MTQALYNIQGLIIVVISTFTGGKIFSFLGQTADSLMPVWVKDLIGPFGALVFMGFAIRWLLNHQEKLETKIDNRENERDTDRKQLITVLETNNSLIKTNNELIGVSNVVIKTNNEVIDKVTKALNEKK